MPRPPRLDPPGTWHHVMNRGARRQHVFVDDRDREDFIDLLRQLEPRFGVEVHLYCLVGNHFHVVVRSRDRRISDGMKFLSERFTRHSNDRHGYDGAVFRGRFHSRIVTNDEHHRWLFNYVHSNARDTGWRGPLEQFPWSSLSVYFAMSAHRDRWLCTEFYSDLFGSDVARMADFVGSEASPPPLGTSISPTLDRRKNGLVLAQPAPPPRPPRLTEETALEVAAVRVSTEWDCPTSTLLDVSRGTCNEPRLAFALIAADVLGCPTSLIADYLGLSSAASCRVLLTRSRRRVEDDPEFAASIHRTAHATQRRAA